MPDVSCNDDLANTDPISPLSRLAPSRRKYLPIGAKCKMRPCDCRRPNQLTCIA
ncbi:hypothetical protein SC1_00483 [Sphingopyxis sp. C-1]|nr:hypothetical protein SC1_00483 [Sphingopyxis sp. C-1]